MAGVLTVLRWMLDELYLLPPLPRPESGDILDGSERRRGASFRTGDRFARGAAYIGVMDFVVVGRGDG